MSLRDFYFTVPQSLLLIIKRLQSAGYRVVIVGGALRDFLRGATVCEYDLASDARPEQVQELFRRCKPTGLQHGTVTILQGKDSYEITTFRNDGIYKDGRHPEQVLFTGDLQGDLARRDFTINALAFEPSDTSGLHSQSKFCRESVSLQGWLYDHCDGLKHLQTKQICAIGRAGQRFAEDALRMLRACRFSASLGFALEAETLSAMREWRGNLAQVSRPRIREELRKLLVAPFALQGLSYLQDSLLWEQVFPHLPSESRHLLTPVWQSWQSDAGPPALLRQMAAKRGITLLWHEEQVPKFSFFWALLHLATLAPSQLWTESAPRRLARLARALAQLAAIFSPSLGGLAESKNLTETAARGMAELCFSNREKNGALGLLCYSNLIWAPEFLYLYQSPPDANVFPKLSAAPKNDGPDNGNKIAAIRAFYIRSFLAIFGANSSLPALYLLGLSGRVGGVPTELWQQFCRDLLDVLGQRPIFSVQDLAIDGKMLSDCGVPTGPHMGQILRKLLGHVLWQPQDNDSQTLQRLTRKYYKQGYDLGKK